MSKSNLVIHDFTKKPCLNKKTIELIENHIKMLHYGNESVDNKSEFEEDTLLINGLELLLGWYKNARS